VTRARIRLDLELLRPEPLARALAALEAAQDRREGEPLARVARAALPGLAAAVEAEEARLRGLLGEGAGLAAELAAGRLAQARLEAVLATAPEPPASRGALEEVAWALLRAARVAPPVSLGEDWDLLRALLDPARRRGKGLGAVAATLAGSALAGEGPLETASGFALARAASYATGWNSPERVRRIARSLERLAPVKLAHVAERLSPSFLRGIYPSKRSPLARRLERAQVALDRLREAYTTAATAGAGIFVELVLY
jgi:hypothetical protein